MELAGDEVDIAPRQTERLREPEARVREHYHGRSIGVHGMADDRSEFGLVEHAPVFAAR